MGTVKDPLHQIYLKSNLFTRVVKVGMHDNLHMRGVNFILSNDSCWESYAIVRGL